MSELHFDNEGEPARVPADCEELRVRRFRKPGERGACEVVHDSSNGAPLYVPVDMTYVEFRKAVDHAPGRYRLDPVDAGRRACAGAVPLYVTIEPRRNAANGGDDRDSFLGELLRANTDQMRVSTDVTRVMVGEIKLMLGAVTDLVRTVTGAGLTPRALVPPAAPEPEPADDDDDDEDDHEPTNPLAETVAHFLQQAMPLLETYLADKMAARRRAETAAVSVTTAPAVAAPVESAPLAQSVVTPPPSAAPAPSATTAAVAAAPVPPADGGGSVIAAATAAPSATAAPVDVRNAAAPTTPSPEQMQHLIAVKAKLAPDEQRVVMTAIPRMDPTARAHWLAQLCSLPVEEAAALVRSMMPPLRPTPTRKDKTP